jgi:biopolymer transport protein ExbD
VTKPIRDRPARAERTTPYEKIAEVMSASARAGLSRIGFVTEPARR